MMLPAAIKLSAVMPSSALDRYTRDPLFRRIVTGKLLTAYSFKTRKNVLKAFYENDEIVL